MRLAPRFPTAGQPRRLARLGLANSAFWPGASVALDFTKNQGRIGLGYGSQDITSLPGWSFSRTGVEYALNSAGLLVPFSSGTPAITDLGLQVWEARTNACTNTNINPADTTNLTTSGDAAAVLTVVTDTAALAAIGLTGKAFKLDNSLGVATADVIINGTTGSASNASVSAHVRATAGTARIRFNGANLASTTSAAYSRLKGENQVTAGTDKLIIRADAASVVFFVANQLETGATAGPVIPVAGAAATRGAAAVSVGGLSIAPPFSVLIEAIPGAAAATMPFRRLFELSDGTANNRIRVTADTDNSAGSQVYDGGVLQANMYNGSNWAAGVAAKSAMRVATNNFAHSHGGAAVTTDALGSLQASYNTLTIGAGLSVAEPADMQIKRLVVVPRALSDAELQVWSA